MWVGGVFGVYVWVPDVRGCKLIPIDVTDVTLEPIKRSDEIFA